MTDGEQEQAPRVRSDGLLMPWRTTRPARAFAPIRPYSAEGRRFVTLCEPAADVPSAGASPVPGIHAVDHANGSAPANATDHDNPWKEALTLYFEPFMALLWPEHHARIDWSVPPEFLDTELRKLVRDAGSGLRRADKLVRVHLASGSPLLVLIHVEVQGRVTAAFPARMFGYYYRLRDAYPDARLISLAVLTRQRAGDPWLEYRDPGYDDELKFRFPVVNLGAWRDRWAARRIEARQAGR